MERYKQINWYETTKTHNNPRTVCIDEITMECLSIQTTLANETCHATFVDSGGTTGNLLYQQWSFVSAVLLRRFVFQNSNKLTYLYIILLMMCCVQTSIYWKKYTYIFFHQSDLIWFKENFELTHNHDTVYPKKYAHGFVVLCFVVVMQSFIMNSHEVFIHIHQGCFPGTGEIDRLPQCQWSKPDGYGKISQCMTTTKHSKAVTVCIFLGIYCKCLSFHSRNLCILSTYIYGCFPNCFHIQKLPHFRKKLW